LVFRKNSLACRPGGAAETPSPTEPPAIASNTENCVMPYDDELNAFLKSGAKPDTATAERRSEKPLPHHEGRVVTYDAAKRFGWITQGADAADLFVHVRELQRAGIANLRRGDRLRFDIQPNKRGGKPHAVNLKLVA
jgi:cold shock protein